MWTEGKFNPLTFILSILAVLDNFNYDTNSFSLDLLQASYELLILCSVSDFNFPLSSNNPTKQLIFKSTKCKLLT